MNKQLSPSFSQQTFIMVSLKNIYHSYEDFVSSLLNLGQDVVYVSLEYKSVQSESREKNRHRINSDEKSLLKNSCIQLHTPPLLFHFSTATKTRFFQLTYYLKLFIMSITRLGRKKKSSSELLGKKSSTQLHRTSVLMSSGKHQQKYASNFPIMSNKQLERWNFNWSMLLPQIRHCMWSWWSSLYEASAFQPAKKTIHVQAWFQLFS